MKNVSIYIDLAFCLIVLPVMAIIFPIERWFHHFPCYVIAVGAWLYALYLLNRVLTVPSLFRCRRRRWLGLLLIAVSVAVTCIFANITLYNPKPSIHDLGITRILPSVQQYQQAVWSLFMIVEAFSFAVGLLTQANTQKSRRLAVEAQRDKAEIELYRAQIKPHFMFNTLNSLYGLFLTRDEKALKSLEKYISMLRYIHTTSRRDFVPLHDEVDYIQQYVGLQSLRLNEMTSVELKTDIADNNLQIPPMLLVTFVENCFKHGVSPIERSNITVELTEKQRHLVFYTRNRIFSVRRIGEHMGIENCRKRLELLYPGRHRMEISDDGKYYQVNLNIDL